MNEILDFILAFWIYFCSFLVVVIILKLLFGAGVKFYHSHWNTLIDDFEYSTQDFYQRFKKELLSKGISGITADDVSLQERNIFSSRRRYIRVKWKKHYYYICAAAFGDGFFISWWLTKKKTWVQLILGSIPWLGNIILRLFYTLTFYKIDTASMLMTYCHKSALKVIDDITDDKGIRLSETDRKPILNEIFMR